MLICIDARPLVEKKVGFGVFLENTLLELLKIDSENQYLLLSDRKVWFDTRNYQNIAVLQYRDSIVFPKSFYYYCRLANYLRKKKIVPDVFWGTEHLMPVGLPKRTKKVLTLHDFTHKRFPETTTKYNLLVSNCFFEKSIRNSDAIVCISNNTRSELNDYVKGIDSKEILTIYSGGLSKKNNNKIIPDACTKPVDLRINGEYILFIGTIEPRKNIEILIKSAEFLKGYVNVVVCGKIGWESKDVIHDLRNTENLIYLDYVSNEEKNFLLSHCFCLVQPSLYEGFGLPIVEGMQSGAVTVVADNSSLKEIVEMEELKFHTESVTSFCNTIKNLKDSPELYARAKDYCWKRGQFFSWEKTAQEYCALFNK